MADLERLEHWLDDHLCDTEGREVAKWHEAIMQTYIDRTGDSPPTATGGNQGLRLTRVRGVPEPRPDLKKLI